MINPDNVLAYYKRAILYLQEGDMEKCLENLLKVLELNPNF
jgi:hypothetical protein